MNKLNVSVHSVLALATALAITTASPPRLAATPMTDLNLVQPIGRISQQITPEDLAGTIFKVKFRNGTQVTCYYSQTAGPECSQYFSVGLGTNAGNWNAFTLKTVKPGTGWKMQEVEFWASTIDTMKEARYLGAGDPRGRWGMLAIDIPTGAGDGRGTVGSGVGHDPASAGMLRYQLLGEISPDLFRGIKFELKPSAGGEFRFRVDLDRLHATPEPGTMAMLGTATSMAGIAGLMRKMRRWRRKRKDQLVS